MKAQAISRFGFIEPLKGLFASVWGLIYDSGEGPVLVDFVQADENNTIYYSAIDREVLEDSYDREISIDSIEREILIESIDREIIEASIDRTITY